MYEKPRPPYDNELYHHGVKGMHWGIRRYQPYRKGDKVKGGKEIGKATKVEQRSLADRVKKGIAAVNKIKKELHKGKLEKAEYKYEMSQLKDARKEVKKARRRQAEERIRERIREHREEERENKRLEEERRDRNLERAKGIAESAAQIGALAYSAYQLKKRMQDNGILGSSGGPAAPGSSSPTIHTPISSSSHSGPTHTLSTPASSSSSSSSSHPLTIHTSGSHSQPTGTTLPTALRGNTSQSIRESRKSTITNNLNRAIQNLSSKSNKSDSDTYALLALRALQQRVNNTDSNSNAFNNIDHLAGLTPEQLIRRQRDIHHEDTDQNELYHYGVKGMHWGIRRYQPYPKGSNKGRFVGTDKYGNSGEKDKEGISEVALYGAVTGIYMAAIGLAVGSAAIAEKVEDNKVKKRVAKCNKEREEATIDKKTGLKVQATQKTPKENLERVNPEYKRSDTGASNNCVNCSITTEMRRRGYEVQAKLHDSGRNTMEFGKKCFPKAKQIDVVKPPTYNRDDPDEFLRFYRDAEEKARTNSNKELYHKTRAAAEQLPVGARGLMSVRWNRACGHALAWEINAEGQFVIYDGQVNKIYTGSQTADVLKHACSAQLLRVDESNFNAKMIKEATR